MSVSRVQSVSRLLYKAPVWSKANPRPIFPRSCILARLPAAALHTGMRRARAHLPYHWHHPPTPHCARWPQCPPTAGCKDLKLAMRESLADLFGGRTLVRCTAGSMQRSVRAGAGSGCVRTQCWARCTGGSPYRKASAWPRLEQLSHAVSSSPWSLRPPCSRFGRCGVLHLFEDA